MKVFDKQHTDDRGVSPVLGVALLVAMTVILAGVIGFVVLGVDSGSADAPQPKLQFQENADGNIAMIHEGGDRIDTSRTEIVVNETDRIELTNGTMETGDSVDTGVTAGPGTEIRIVWDDPDSERKVQIAEYRVE